MSSLNMQHNVRKIKLIVSYDGTDFAGWQRQANALTIQGTIEDKLKVMTAEEVSAMGKTHTPAQVAEKVDVVTTATFGPMCSSGAFLNFGHSAPKIRMTEAWLETIWPILT